MSYNKRKSSTGRRGRRKRPYGRRRRRKRAPAATRLIVRGPWICPDSYFVKLPYTETFNISAASYVDTIFRGSSVYDPYFTGTGHQPLGYDQLVALYGKYTVMGCKVQLTVMSTNSAVTGSDVQFSIVASNDSGGFVSYDLVSETPYNKTRYIGNASTGPRTISSYYSSAKILGVSKQKLVSDDEFSAAYNTNPNHNWYIHFFISDLTADNLICTYKVKLIYYVKFWDRVKLTAS